MFNVISLCAPAAFAAVAIAISSAESTMTNENPFQVEGGWSDIIASASVAGSAAAAAAAANDVLAQDVPDSVDNGREDGHGSCLPYFIRSYNGSGSAHTIASPEVPAWLAGANHFRLLPGVFPTGMEYHFDGLATVMKFTFSADGKAIHYFSKPYGSRAAIDYEKCIFFGT